MRRALFLSLSLTALVLAGCPSKPKNGECKSSGDCKSQEGFGKTCVQGRCQECGADTDCKAGFSCRDAKCAPRPECDRSEDCGSGKACEAGHCIAAAPKAECDSDATCGSGRACESGRCIAKVDDATSAAAAVAKCGGEEHAVRFAFNRSDLDAPARSSLEGVASCLKAVRGARVLVEGHCDQRGTTEYNLHLGERRAESVKKYLLNLGVDAGAVKTTSYGKERPVCEESTEDCWSRNRRGVVKPEGADRS